MSAQFSRVKRYILTLTANPAKCQWGAHSLTYLGYEVGKSKINIPEARIKAIHDYKRPNTKKGLKAFLGTTGYYRRFVPDCAGRAGPLYNALRKVAPNTYLISSPCSSNVLWLPRDGDEMVLHTDASTQGIGVVLSADRGGVQRPIGYFSKRLLPAETNYAATECLAVFKAVDHFAVHLVGGHFRVVTDHRALTSLLSSTKLNGKLMRWALALQTYDFDIVHRPCSSHQNADSLFPDKSGIRSLFLVDPRLWHAREGEMLEVTRSNTLLQDDNYVSQLQNPPSPADNVKIVLFTIQA